MLGWMLLLSCTEAPKADSAEPADPAERRVLGLPVDADVDSVSRLP